MLSAAERMGKKIIVILLVLMSVTSCGRKIYEVRYEINGGTLVSGELLQETEAGGSTKEPQVEREGYVFEGWSDSSENIQKNKVIVANWKQLYEITFDVNGGEVREGDTRQEIAENDMPVPPMVEREDYDFLGWKPEICAAVEDTTYEAQWEMRELSSEEIYQRISPAVPVILIDTSDGNESLGSGFFIDNEGTLVTNYHVIDEGISGFVRFQDGEEYDILWIKNYDATKDLAILKIDCNNNKFLTISSEGVVTGETVYTLGAPLGLDDTFSNGIVSKASRDMDGVNLIQTTAPISPGNSGGPLVDIYGHVVGINSLTATEGQNLNFAIDVRELDSFLTEPDMNKTLEELNREMHPDAVPSIDPDLGVYGISDYEEQEPNDITELADVIENDHFTAGMITDATDLDIYRLSVKGLGTGNVEVIPQDDYNIYNLKAAVGKISPDEDRIVAFLDIQEWGESYLLTAEVEFEEESEYYLVVAATEEYDPSFPIYYAATVSW